MHHSGDIRVLQEDPVDQRAVRDVALVEGTALEAVHLLTWVERATRTTPTTLPGLGTVLAAKVLGHIGDISRFPTEHHFASYTGSAPLDASSGNNVRHRLNTGGTARSTRSCTPSPSARSTTAARATLLPPQDR
ncbi:transposase [Streptomyces sp. NPDC003710]